MDVEPDPPKSKRRVADSVLVVAWILVAVWWLVPVALWYGLVGYYLKGGEGGTDWSIPVFVVIADFVCRVCPVAVLLFSALRVRSRRR